MEQALKVIQFDSEENPEENRSKGGKRTSTLSYLLVPLSTAAIITAILGVISLILEVKIYFQFRYEIYLARLFPTLISFITLILLQTKFGKKNHVQLTHIYLVAILSSLGFVGYKISSLFLYNLAAASIFILTLSLFLYWGRNNQIVAGAYFSIIFGVFAYLSNIVFAGSDEVLLFLGFSLLTVIISVFVSNQRTSSKSVKRNKVKANSSELEESLENSKGYWGESIIPIFELKLNGEFEYANDALCEVLEITDGGEVFEKNLFKDFIKNEKVETHLLKKIESKGKVENYRFTVAKNDGSNDILIMDCKSKKINEEVYLEGTIRNITQQYLKDKSLLNELESLKQSKRQSSKIIPNFSDKDVKKSNVISKMGHELRTPMNSVLGFLTLIENGLFENEEELKEFSHSAKLSAESLLGLINDVVEIAKIQEGTVEIVKDEFKLDEMIERLTLELTPHLKQNNLILNTSIAENVPNNIDSDQSKYAQILVNLLRNATQVSEGEKVNLTISTKVNSEGKINLITSVEDSGKGIPQEQLERLIKNNISQKKGDPKITANALHIMICSELVSLLNGEFFATSDIGKGTKFSFSIELENNESVEKEILTQHNDLKSNTYSKAKLLLVEDNPISRKVEQKLLQEAGYEVDCVDNATAAIGSVEKGTYDLILMDIELKDMDGLDATKAIRQLPAPICDIPIIAVTAHSSMKDREKCLVAGMNDYISKPINITFLKMTIDQWLNEARAELQ